MLNEQSLPPATPCLFASFPYNKILKAEGGITAVIIRKAEPADAISALAFYHDLIDKMKDSAFRPTWAKGVYPLLSDLEAAISKSSLFIAVDDARIVGAVMVTDKEDESYQQVNWGIITDRVAVIHLIASDPDLHGRGIGRKLLEKCREDAAARGAETIRLDTLPYNTPARHLYESFGFEYRGEIELCYPPVGTIPFAMYEYVL